MATGSVWLCVSMCVSGFNHHQIELCVQVIKVVPNRLPTQRHESGSRNNSFASLSKCCGRLYSRSAASFNTELNAAPSQSPLLTVWYSSKPWITFPPHKLTIIPGLWNWCGLQGLVCNHSMSTRIPISVCRWRTALPAFPHTFAHWLHP